MITKEDYIKSTSLLNCLPVMLFWIAGGGLFLFFGIKAPSILCIICGSFAVIAGLCTPLFYKRDNNLVEEIFLNGTQVVGSVKVQRYHVDDNHTRIECGYLMCNDTSYKVLGEEVFLKYVHRQLRTYYVEAIAANVNNYQMCLITKVLDMPEESS